MSLLSLPCKADRKLKSVLGRWIGLSVLAVMLLPFLATPSQARTHRHHARVVHSNYIPPRSASLLMNSDTGLILEQQNADVPLHPASLTKTMTLLLTFEALERGNLRLTDSVPISNHAASMSPSKLGLLPGSSILVQDAIYAVVIHSANDIAVALAEKLGGTEGRFASMMNRRAKDLGMTRTHFVNASGLPSPGQFSTARDMALLARDLITEHPRYYRYFAIRDFTYRGKIYYNHNHLMETYRGMDGLKTGYIQESGFNLIASAKRDGHRLIGVVFGGRSTATRNAEMASLLDQGFERVNSRVYIATAQIPAPTGPMKLTKADAVSHAEDDEPDTAMPTNTAVTGQGDSDPTASITDQVESAPVVVAAPVRQNATVASNVTAAPLARAADAWAIQVGAYNSRAKTDHAIRIALTTLPPVLTKVDPVIVPLKTQGGWIFRGRLSGYSRDQAYAACKILSNCTPVSPVAY